MIFLLNDFRCVCLVLSLIKHGDSIIGCIIGHMDACTVGIQDDVVAIHFILVDHVSLPISKEPERCSVFRSPAGSVSEYPD